MATVDVDARGLRCPMPVIRLAQAVSRADSGDTLVLASTDPTSKVDVPVWCRMQGHTLVEVTQADDGAALFHVRHSR